MYSMPKKYLRSSRNIWPRRREIWEKPSNCRRQRNLVLSRVCNDLSLAYHASLERSLESVQVHGSTRAQGKERCREKRSTNYITCTCQSPDIFKLQSPVESSSFCRHSMAPASVHIPSVADGSTSLQVPRHL